MKRHGISRMRRAVVAGAWLSAAWLCNVTTSRADDRIDFARDVRPLLSDYCFQCHGPDASQRQADLRLDTREGLVEARKPALVVPGKAADSELLRRVTSSDPDEVMPPPKTGKKLTPNQVAVLRRWIDQGATWSQHWAFVPPVRPPVPEVPHEGASERPRNAIDSFVRARLMKASLAPAPAADPVTLLRRLSLDLIGLPPTPAEVDAFLADAKATSADAAYRRQIERLLQSPHYGERWARHWLDAARYADSDGYEKDKSRQVWFYRDWVVATLQRDLPYDRFVIEQLAGDLLPNATPDQHAATGFLRNSMINEEGGIDPEQFRMEAMFDRMDAIGRSILGLTIQCGQCHSHKYDPLTQSEYYGLFAYLNECDEASIPVYTPAEWQQIESLRRGIREIEADLRHQTPDWEKRLTAWESALPPPPEWEVVPVRNSGDNSQRYVYHADGSQTAWGYAPTKWTSQFRGQPKSARITAVRLELLNDANLPLGGPGRSPLGLSALSELTADLIDPSRPDQKTPVKFASATADFGNEERLLEPVFDDRSNKRRVTGPIEFAIDGKDDTAWGIDAGPGRRNVARHAVFVLATPLDLPAGASLTFYLKQMHGGWNSDDNQNNNLGRFRFSVTSSSAPAADRLPPALRTILSRPRDGRSPVDTAALFGFWRTQQPEFADANARIEALWRQHPAGSSQLTLAPRSMPRGTSLLARGDFLKPTQRVEPGVPAFLNALPDDARLQPPRLAFARWLVDRRAPTAARAIVNRVWQTYFGTGLVATSEDLGSQGDRPSHPELLDWLAVEFMDRGWSFKELHRQIVDSATYRQSAVLTPESLTRDPENRLLARGPRFRVEAESVRDIALAASGLLNAQVGGPSVFPPAPDFLFLPPASYGPKVWKESTGPDRYRRALYTFRFRSVPYPMLQTFDAPNGDFACVRRVRSNTPLQALTSLNEPLFLECARHLARTTLESGGPTDDARLTYAFRRCLARRPTPAETNVLRDLLNKELARYSAANAAPQALLSDTADRPPTLPAGATAAQLAAWTVVSRVLLNLDETITKE